MPIKKLTPSFTFTEDRLAELRAVVPEAFADGMINWETLREALGDYVEEEGQNAESFGLSWPGKRQARRLAAMPSKGTLKPATGEGVDEATTHNLFIEGDNLEVLKLLQKSYAGRVKMIYIDPPYNTGNDFVYRDDFREPLEDYLRKTGQLGEEGELLTSNPKASGRFHSIWLSMVYPRLLLAKQLLREDGVIFVSIDDNEVHSLRAIMAEVFGEENFIGQFVVQVNPRGRHLDKFVAKTHEYVIAFALDASQQPLFQLEKDDRMTKEYSKRDARGAYRELELRNRNPAFNSKTRPNLYYPIYVDPSTFNVALERSSRFSIEVYPKNSAGQDSCWTWGTEKFKRENELLLARQTSEGGWRVFRRDYLVKTDGTSATTLPKSIWLDQEFTNDAGRRAVQDVFDGQTVFDFPKSPMLLQRLVEIGTDSNTGGIVLDFFAGSGSLAEAVLELNKGKPSNRSFILVQMPEQIAEPTRVGNKRLTTIAEIGKERIRRIIKRIKAEQRGRLGLDSDNDLGFRVFKIARSNQAAWQDYDGEDVTFLEDLFSKAQHPLVDGWQTEDVLVEILLLEGFPLDSTVSERRVFTKNRVQIVESEACAHRLIVCLDPGVHASTIAQLDGERNSNDIFICLDNALSDEAKVRLADLVKLHVI